MHGTTNIKFYELIFSHTCYMPSPAHNSLFFHLNSFDEECQAQSSSLSSLLHYPVTSSLLGPNILLNTQFSNNLKLCSFLTVSNQVSHPYKTTGKITVSCISRSNDVMQQNPMGKVAAPFRACKYGSSAFGCDLNPFSFSFSAMTSNSLDAIFFFRDLAEKFAIITRNANAS